MRFSRAGVVVALLAAHAAWAADAPPFPSDMAMKKTQQARPHLPSADDVRDAARRARGKLFQFNPDRVAVPSFPSLTKQPSVHTDFNEVVRNAQKAGHGRDAQRASPGLLVFVSFSMPAESLKRLVRQAEQVHAAILLRGLVSDSSGRPSFRATADAVRRSGVDGVSINPVAFERFHVSNVPSFVLLLEDECPSCGDGFIPRHLKISGDVSMDYALRAMKTRRPEAQSRADAYLDRLKSGFFARARESRR